ncbi:hypothetical protein VP1G_04206 [Cytospora mali]|uniref:Uncharacterized protein n=1 Tax=Cytospora mali TaxID=578113 RepID=A0A194UYT9_CYTMA|nr:hypothetical protein VP1G_04206 [Valsa mali var. pyri (nom. inval.)]
MGFRRTMRRWFGSRYKQMSNREVQELDKQITTEMRTGTFRAVQKGPQGPTADQLWEEEAEDRYPDTASTMMPSSERLPTMSSSIGAVNRPPTAVSQASRGNRYYDEYGDGYGGYQDGYGYGYASGGGGGASSDSGYAAGYYERPSLLPPPPPSISPRLPGQSPAWYVPGGGPFDMVEARPESVYDGGSRANSMRSNMTRASRRPPTQQNGYLTPVRPFRENRSFSMQSDPGRLYARSPRPRMPYSTTQPSWDGPYYDGGAGGGSTEGFRGYEGGGWGNGYRGWNGGDIGEHEYPLDDTMGYGEGNHYPGS